MNNTQAQQSNQTQGASSNQLTDYQQLARIAARFFLLSSIIINTTREDRLLVIASKLGLLAGFLLARAAELEAREQQTAPGRTTLANNLKLLGTKGAIFSAFLLFSALIIEVALKQPPSVAGQTTGAGGAGALFF